MVKTDNVCFISDCMATDGYDWNYHHSDIKDLFFDGEKPQKTFSANWLQIKQYPSKIEKLVGVPSTNRRYEIKNKNLVSEDLPEIINYEECDNYDEDILVLYTYNDDKHDPILQDIEYEIEVVFEVENFELPPVFNYKAIKKVDFANKEFNITNVNVSHQLFDKLIFPEVMLHTRPCSISSQNLYSLVRQYVKDNIDTKVAKITSDYDFCFSVKKIIPLIEPKTVSYQNIFAKTKKERSKIQYATSTYKEVDIFEMTHAQSKYNNYTVIQPIFADNENQLKEKLDNFLEDLITIINQPLKLCEHCNGTGYAEEVSKIKQSDITR